MYHHLELARSGEALFKPRGNYLKYVGFTTGPYSQLPDNLLWYYIRAATLLAYRASRGLRYFINTYDNIS